MEEENNQVAEPKQDRLAALKEKIQEKKKALLSSKLSKKVLGTDKKLRAQIEKTELKRKANEKFLSYYDSLTTTETGGLVADFNETTRQFRSKNLAPHLSLQSQGQIFQLALDFGNYRSTFSNDGSTLLLAGSKGHLALLDWKNKQPKKEWHVKERIRDAKFLQNERMVAVAQKEHCHVYDDQGLEVHRLRNMPEPLWLEYLQYHFLLCSISAFGLLSYQDISTGQIVAEHKTKIRDATFLRQNPYNGMLLTGNDRGVVKMWAPNSGTALISIFCHSSHVVDAAVTRDGYYMATIGSDSLLKVFDLRTYGEVHQYFTPLPASNLAISQKGLLSLACRDQVITWKDWNKDKQKAPYMKQETTDRRTVCDLEYVNYEDCLGVGQVGGFETMLVPGSGENNYDAFESGIGVSRKTRSNMEVRRLVEKLPANTIGLDPNQIYTISNAAPLPKELEKIQAAQRKKNKMRGKHRADKGELVKNDKRDRIRSEMIRNNNIARLKARNAEKVKKIKEVTEIEGIEQEIAATIPNVLRNRFSKGRNFE